jgi:hypothetical protein
MRGRNWARLTTLVLAGSLTWPMTGQATAAADPVGAPTQLAVQPLGFSGDPDAYNYAGLTWAAPASPVDHYAIHDHDLTSGADDQYALQADAATTAVYINGAPGHSIDYWVTAVDAGGNESDAASTVRVDWPSFLNLIPQLTPTMSGPETGSFSPTAATDITGLNGQPDSYQVTVFDESKVWPQYETLPAPIPDDPSVAAAIHNAYVQRMQQDALGAGDLSSTETVPAGPFTVPLPYTGNPYGVKIAAHYPDGQVTPNSLVQLISPLPADPSPTTCSDEGCITAAFPSMQQPGLAKYLLTATEQSAPAGAAALDSSPTTRSVYGTGSPLRVPGLLTDHSYSLTVAAINAQGMILAQQNLGTARTSAPSLGPLTAPVIVGLRRTGSTVTAMLGGAPTGAAVAYRWSLDGKPLPAATGSRLTIPGAYWGHKLAVAATVTKPGYQTWSGQSPASTVTAGALTSNRLAMIAGTAHVGSRLRATVGGFPVAGVALHYQWILNGRPIFGATSGALTLPRSYRGKAVQVRVVATAPGMLPWSSLSRAVRVG